MVGRSAVANKGSQLVARSLQQGLAVLDKGLSDIVLDKGLSGADKGPSDPPSGNLNQWWEDQPLQTRVSNSWLDLCSKGLQHWTRVSVARTRVPATHHLEKSEPVVG